MAGSSVSVSTSSGSSSSVPASINSPQTDWGLQLSQLLATLGQHQYNWAQDQFNKTSAVTDAQINNYINTAQQGINLAGNTLGQYEGIYAPLQAQTAQEASQYASEGRIRNEMGRAEAGQTQAGDQARINAEKQLQSFGIDPSSGRYQDLELASNTKTAAAAAAAGENARLTTEATGRQLKQNAIAVGQQLPGATVNSLNSGYQGISGAENSVLGNANTGVNLTDSANPYMGTAAAANKIPPVGNTSQSANQSRGSSSSVQTDPAQRQQQQSPDRTGSTSPTSGANPGAGAKTSSGAGVLSGAGVTQVQPGAEGTGVNDTTPNVGEPTDTGNNDTGNIFDPTTGTWGDQGGVIPNDVSGNPVSDYNPDTTSGADYSQFNATPDNYGAFGDTPTDSGSTDYSSSYDSGGGDYGGDYKRGGPVRGGVLPDMAGGGRVPASMSPSGGQNVDDVPAVISQTGEKANLNAEEFVIPRDVMLWKGQEHFQKLIQQARKARLGAPAQPTYSQGASNAA